MDDCKKLGLILIALDGTLKSKQLKSALEKNENGEKIWENPQ